MRMSGLSEIVKEMEAPHSPPPPPQRQNNLPLILGFGVVLVVLVLMWRMGFFSSLGGGDTGGGDTGGGDDTKTPTPSGDGPKEEGYLPGPKGKPCDAKGDDIAGTYNVRIMDGFNKYLTDGPYTWDLNRNHAFWGRTEGEARKYTLETCSEDSKKGSSHFFLKNEDEYYIQCNPNGATTAEFQCNAVSSKNDDACSGSDSWQLWHLEKADNGTCVPTMSSVPDTHYLDVYDFFATQTTGGPEKGKHYGWKTAD